MIAVDTRARSTTTMTPVSGRVSTRFSSRKKGALATTTTAREMSSSAATRP
jgi:hypothetical protein